MVKVKRYASDIEKEKYKSKTYKESDFNKYQKMAFGRWAKHYGYKSWQGYATSRKGIEWDDYSWLRKHSP